MKITSFLVAAFLLSFGTISIAAAAGVGDEESVNPQNDSNRPLNSVGNLGPTLGDSEWQGARNEKIRCRNPEYRKKNKITCQKYPSAKPQSGSGVPSLPEN